MSTNQQSSGSRLVIMANTLPVRRVTQAKGRSWQISPGGLVSALVPIVQQREGAWIGWTGAVKDTPPPFVHDDILNMPVPLSAEEADYFYQGFCNRTLWPLYHGATRPPEYHRHWWRGYVAVNARFAEAAADVAAPNASVWVQDYHLHLVPRMLRIKRPDLQIGFFLHVPFPPEELFTRLPWRSDILLGMLGADVVGFQTQIAVRNFLGLAPRYTDARRTKSTLQLDGRDSRVQAFPISIDFDRFDSTARLASVCERRNEVRESLVSSRKIVLGVDRLDYTKGIDLRMKAYRELLLQGRTTIRDSVFVQVAVPSRERVEEYRELRRDVEELVGQINGEFGDVGVPAVHYLRRNLAFHELVAMYCAADVMLVTPLADGMNLVSKEYVACRFTNDGVLVLSEFAGASEELRAAVRVNPHDLDGLAESIEQGLVMPTSEQKRRMRRMRQTVRRHTIYDWATAFLDALTPAGAGHV